MSYMNNKVGKNDTLYHPINENKYMGDINKIVCRSSWEHIFCSWADNNQSVIQWGSEVFGIPYHDPSKKDVNGMPKKRTYYPDYVLKIQDITGKETIWIVEIKPKVQTVPPRVTKNKSQSTIIKEQQNWIVNQSKWMAANRYCKLRKWQFKIITEDQLITK